MSAVMLCDVPLNVNVDWIKTVLSGCGPILEVSRWTTTGLFFVLFEMDSSACEAVQHFHRLVFPGHPKPLSVIPLPPSLLAAPKAVVDGTPHRSTDACDCKPALGPNAGQSLIQTDQEDLPTSLFVYRICPNADECDIRALFEQFGHILQIRLDVHLSTQSDVAISTNSL
eukprot:TRINITY_DN8445_c0_g1_i2.p1 TRINITY_DN8445_c0_g1~~TRINITY_DN8445_c0_g1_i2.p1  ORF type:complete len:187 (-),score=31.53 TRINITY_DN8445_c0_g1_i2:58-567(-)